jgi:hypothetical protein
MPSVDDDVRVRWISRKVRLGLNIQDEDAIQRFLNEEDGMNYNILRGFINGDAASAAALFWSSVEEYTVERGVYQNERCCNNLHCSSHVMFLQTTFPKYVYFFQNGFN